MLIEHKWKRTFFMIAFGQAISLIGSSAVQFALIWWLAEKTSSPIIMGISGIAAFLPMTFLSPFAGVAADRYNRKFICITSDMLMGIMAFLYAILLYFFNVPVWTVLVMLFIRGIGNTFQGPAIQSIIPQLVPSDQLIKVNGWTQLMNSGSFILGPVIGAVLYATVPMSVILISDVIGAIFASITLAVAKIPKLKLQQTTNDSFLLQFKEGITVYKQDKKLLMLVIAQSLCMLFYMPLSSFYPLMTSNYFKLSAIYGSIVETGFAVGMLIAAVIFSSGLKIKYKIRLSYIGLIGIGLTCTICGMVPPVFGGWIIFAIICSCMGAFGNVHTIPITAYMQETISPEKMGRAFSLLSLIGSLAMPLGLLVSSPIAEKIGVRSWFFVSGIGIILIVGVILFADKIGTKTNKTKNT